MAMRQNLHEFPDLVRLAHRPGDRRGLRPAPLPRLRRVEPARRTTGRCATSSTTQTLVGEDPDRVQPLLRRGPRGGRASWASTSACPRTRPRLHPPGTPGPERCDWPWRGAYVSYQGLAMPCCMVATPDRINFGNMADDGAEAVWNGAGLPGLPRRPLVRDAARGLPLVRDLLGDVLNAR